MTALSELIVRANFALAVVALGVAVTWGLSGATIWRRPGFAVLALISVGWLVASPSALFWGTSRYGRWSGEGGTQWMTDSLAALIFLLLFIAVAMGHIIKATWAHYGWWPAALWAVAAAVAWTWPGHIVGAVRALTGI